MRYLITGAGQIGTQLALDLTHDGHDVVVLRRSDTSLPGTRTISGDAGDPAIVRTAAAEADAIFHCIHAAYSAKIWRRELPHREQAVMNVAAELNIPVVFPESVYAFGRGAAQLSETSQIAPVSPLGRVRAELLKARAMHPARTASVVASDLFGPTATRNGSVVLSTVVEPARKGLRAWVLGDPDAPHAVTHIPDLTRAMTASVPLATENDATLIAPTAPARSLRHMAEDAAARAGQESIARVTRVPAIALASAALFSATARELFKQRYLWNAPSTLVPGRLTTELGLEATPWSEILTEYLEGVRPEPAARP